jgi:hypothetical protein
MTVQYILLPIRWHEDNYSKEWRFVVTQIYRHRTLVGTFFKRKDQLYYDFKKVAFTLCVHTKIVPYSPAMEEGPERQIKRQATRTTACQLAGRWGPMK